MHHFRLTVTVLLVLCVSVKCEAQTDSTIESLQEIPLKFIKDADKKIDKYNSRITSKTEKTLTKLSKWENKIKALLEKANPEAAQRLFADNQLTFTAALEKYKKGEAIVAQQKARYDEYSDKLTTNLKYLYAQKDKLDEKFIKPVKNAKQKVIDLEKQETNTQATEQFIKERKKQLINEAVKYIGNSKYLTKINKESYYYIETLKNYKQLFNDKKKAEETALTILNKIPAFSKFVKQNSVLVSLFGIPGNNGASNIPTTSLAGLQTRASVNVLIQDRIASGGPNAQQQIQQNMQAAQAELKNLKDKILKSGGSNSDLNIPDFKPNNQKTKTFRQRIEFGTNFQTTKSNGYLPSTTDLGLSVGYKLNDKSIIGLGASYKLGLGKDISHIQLSSEGVGVRSFVDYKLKKSFWLSGGAEMNYLNRFNSIITLQSFDAWQSSALLGLSKKYKIGKKTSNMQLLYDFLYRQTLPVKQPIVFRVGYNF